MAIISEDALVAAVLAAQPIQISKLATRVTTASTPFSVFDLAGQPGAGVLAGTSLAAGVVPTDATAGFPNINAFASGRGFLSGVQFGSSVAGRLRIFDVLWKGGAYAFNAAQAVTSPSWSSRVPGGTDYGNTQLWVEAVTAFTGIPSVAVQYTDDAGNAGATTGAFSAGVASTVGRMTQLPLAAGDNGIRAIERVDATVATVGTFNVLVMRPLWSGRVALIGGGDTHGLALAGGLELFADSALFLQVIADSTSTGIPELTLFVGNGN